MATWGTFLVSELKKYILGAERRPAMITQQMTRHLSVHLDIKPFGVPLGSLQAHPGPGPHASRSLPHSSISRGIRVIPIGHFGQCSDDDGPRSTATEGKKVRVREEGGRKRARKFLRSQKRFGIYDGRKRRQIATHSTHRRRRRRPQRGGFRPFEGRATRQVLKVSRYKAKKVQW